VTIIVTVSIDRTSLGKAPLVLSAGQDTTLGLTAYQPPGKVARVTYANDHPDMDGSVALSASWQQALLGFNVVTDQAADEAAIASQVAELVEALAQFSYLVTTTVGNAPAEVWSAQRGSIALAVSDGRSFTDLANHNPVYAITIPVYPIPGSVT
jgi:hypothetical protein